MTQSVSPTAQSLARVTPTPAFTPIPSAALQTDTPTPEPGFSDFAQIRFLSPGSMSKVVSPLQLQMIVISGGSEIVQIELLGEDGRSLDNYVQHVNSYPLGVYRKLKIPFEIKIGAAAELGWLQVSTKDKEGRMQALNSVRVLLLSEGATEINPPGNIEYERVALETPKEKVEVAGGSLEVKGRMWPVNDQPIFLDLILPNRKVIDTRVLEFNGLEPQSFETTIPYHISLPEGVTQPVQVLLTIHQEDPELKIPLYVFTREVELKP